MHGETIQSSVTLWGRRLTFNLVIMNGQTLKKTRNASFCKTMDILSSMTPASMGSLMMELEYRNILRSHPNMKEGGWHLEIIIEKVGNLNITQDDALALDQKNGHLIFNRFEAERGQDG